MKRLTPLILVLTLAGCAFFTKPTNVVSLPRQDFVNAYAASKVLYQKVAAKVEAQCAAGVLTRAECARAAEVDQEIRLLALNIEAKLAVPESEVDWANVVKVLSLVAKLVI